MAKLRKKIIGGKALSRYWALCLEASKRRLGLQQVEHVQIDPKMVAKGNLRCWYESFVATIPRLY
jgi:hypothetical protein